jgi:hypothetical protein
MQQVIQFSVSVEDKRHIEEEANKLGLKSAEFLRLLVKLYFRGLTLERGELTSRLMEQNSLS